MTIDWLTIKIIISVLIILDCAILGSTYFIKRSSRKSFGIRSRLRSLVRKSIVGGNLIDAGTIPAKQRIDYLQEWQTAAQTAELPAEISLEIRSFIDEFRIGDEIVRLLRSRFFRNRARGINLTGFLDRELQLDLLGNSLLGETFPVLRLKIVQLLCEADEVRAIDSIRLSMQGAEEFYKKKVLSMLGDNIPLLMKWADENRNCTDSDSRRIMIMAARTKLRDWFRPFLSETIDGQDSSAAEEAAEVFINIYAEEDELRRLMISEDIEIGKMAAFRFFSSSELPESDEVAAALAKEELRSSVIAGLTECIRETPRLIPELFLRYQLASTAGERTGYAAVLSSRINYFMVQLRGDESGEIRELLDDAIGLGISAPIINFLNTNKNLALEKLLIEALKPHMGSNAYFRQQCQYFLDDDLKEQLELPPVSGVSGKPKIQLSRNDRVYMLMLFLFSMILPLAVFLGINGKVLPVMTGEERLVSFCLMYHHLFAFYTVSINLIYLALMMLSWNVIAKQQISWKIADKKFLYANGLLPTVSILAPAYNEEKTVVQNIYSLLSLDYPNMELIVINDGSGDNTMKLLIEQFDLKLSDFPLSDSIVTAPILGLYRNSKIPNLLVIDKANGGKADALNAGLNAAGGEYVCSIDADSLLEPSALTKLMFQSLNNYKNTVAIGGNIIPVNGCKTKKGAIQEIHLPVNKYSRSQTIEYMRSFITGRLGWSRLNSLLIISGAFGAFRRKEVSAIGGYMTGTGVMKKDTVGEDMELVVRLVRSLHEKGENFHVDYAHNANCWTEVPENLKDLLKQRDRWHRGLIEILLFHKKMMFNKKYRAPGLIAFPYFLIFELLGPFWEFYGYAVLVASLILGLISSQVFLFMFSIVVLLGILVSSTALHLAEHDILYFQGREFMRGVSTVIEENFGYRQLISMHRTVSFISYLLKNKGWQKLDRKGFSAVEEEGSSGEG